MDVKAMLEPIVTPILKDIESLTGEVAKIENPIKERVESKRAELMASVEKTLQEFAKTLLSKENGEKLLAINAKLSEKLKAYETVKPLWEKSTLRKRGKRGDGLAIVKTDLVNDKVVITIEGGKITEIPVSAYYDDEQNGTKYTKVGKVYSHLASLGVNDGSIRSSAIYQVHKNLLNAK